jgi:hypothetical protein
VLHRLLPFLTFVFSVFLFACGAPQTAMDVRHFADAKNNFIASDFKAGLENLDGTIKTTTNDALRQEATVLRVALVTALADDKLSHKSATGDLLHCMTSGLPVIRSESNPSSGGRNTATSRPYNGAW